MELPRGSGAPELVLPVESVRVVHPDRAEGRDNREANARSAEEAGRVEVGRLLPHVAGVVEEVQVEHLAEPDAEFGGRAEEPVAEAQYATLLPVVNKERENHEPAGMMIFGAVILCAAGFAKWKGLI